MKRINHDVVIAIGLLVFCGVMFWASFDIRQPDYGVLPPSAWPRVILAVLTLLSVVYLLQSARQGLYLDIDAEAAAAGPQDLRQWIAYWRNPFWCFFLFALYLTLMPVLGMLVCGMLFVFVLLGMLGGWDRRDLPMHTAVAVFAVGGMWSVFTFGLNVILPRGMIFENFYF